jgi:hypothetical protein
VRESGVPQARHGDVSVAVGVLLCAVPGGGVPFVPGALGALAGTEGCLMWRWSCQACEIESQVSGDQGEVDLWAGIHNRHTHGGRPEALPVEVRVGVSDAA